MSSIAIPDNRAGLHEWIGLPPVELYDDDTLTPCGATITREQLKFVMERLDADVAASPGRSFRVDRAVVDDLGESGGEASLIAALHFALGDRAAKKIRW